jgi:hypothetical protein
MYFIRHGKEVDLHKKEMLFQYLAYNIYILAKTWGDVTMARIAINLNNCPYSQF